MSGLGFGDAQVNAAGDTLTVTVPGQHQSDAANLGGARLNSGPLPVAFEVSTPQVVGPNPGAAGLWHSRPPIGLVITAIGVVVILLSLQVYLYRPGTQRLSARRPK